MPAVPSHAHLLQDCQQLYELLVGCQQLSIEKHSTQIVSLSLEIPPIDPLAALEVLGYRSQLYFYFEKAGKSEALAAVGAALSFTTFDPARFAQVRDFICSCQNRIISEGALHLPFAGAHFFCSFTFFADVEASEKDFPAATVFLPRWQVARRKNCCVFVANLALAPDSNLETLSQSTWLLLQKLCSANYSLTDAAANSEKNYKFFLLNDSDKFQTAVRSALDSIQANHYKKIVLASTIDAFAETRFQIIPSLNNLRRLHPDCYIFGTGNGKGKNFIGASPERLVHIHNQVLVTDALAGSAPRGKTAAEDKEIGERLLKDEKERHEHQIVIDFIVERLSHLGLVPQLSLPARLLKLSNIQHLWTPIIAQVPTDVSILEILAELHPTPAVAGFPREIACQEIRRYETFDRGLYAAPLGWIDRFGNGEFIVGIRSATIEGDRARLYAGAGIVEGSIPEKELTEVQLKLQALLKALV